MLEETSWALGRNKELAGNTLYCLPVLTTVCMPQKRRQGWFSFVPENRMQLQVSAKLHSPQHLPHTTPTNSHFQMYHITSSDL